jgi:hypothetical protein
MAIGQPPLLLRRYAICVSAGPDIRYRKLGHLRIKAMPPIRL